MATWQILSDKFTAPNGLIVEPVGSEEDLIAMGRHFMNGLINPMGRQAWMSQCQRGKRQIYRVLDANGTMVANGELEVKRGQVLGMFVRGHGNREFAAGEREFDAVAAYLDAVNGHRIKLHLDITREGFSNAPEPELTPWQQAVKIAQDKAISPFLALVTGVTGLKLGAPDGAPEAEKARLNPEADPIEEVTWPALTAPFRAPGGYIVEPIGSRSGLRTAGEELENNLIVMHGSYASACQRGQTQFAVIYSEDDGIVAMAELRPVAGQVIPAFCRGRFDAEAPAAAASALVAYVGAVNGRQIERNIEIGANGFAMDGNAPVNPFEGNPDFRVAPTIERSMRNGGYEGGYSGGEDEDDGVEPDYEDEVDEDEDAEDALNETAWDAATEDYVGHLGVEVGAITNGSDLDEILDTLGVGLDTTAVLALARDAEAGRAQFVEIEHNGDTIGVARIELQNGQMVATTTYGIDGAPLAAKGVKALNGYLEAANGEDIEIFAKLEGATFGFDGAPRHTVERDYGDDDGGYRNQRGPVAEPITWQALTDDFVAPNGLTVEVVTDQETLRQMGEQFNNALSTGHGMWARMCREGSRQVVRVLESGEMIGNVEVVCERGQVRALHGVLANHNGLAPDRAREAFEAWCEAVHSRRIALHGTPAENGFTFEAPQAGYGMAR